MKDTLTESDLISIETRLSLATAGPWKSFVEGRDHTSGSSFIMTGSDATRGSDIELLGASEADQDFIASARQDIPKLIAEIRRLKMLLMQ
jgi:hypothetical protein